MLCVWSGDVWDLYKAEKILAKLEAKNKARREERGIVDDVGDGGIEIGGSEGSEGGDGASEGENGAWCKERRGR